MNGIEEQNGFISKRYVNHTANYMLIYFREINLRLTMKYIDK